MKIAINGSRHQENFIEEIKAFMDELSRQGIEVTMHKRLYDYLLHTMPLALKAVRRVCDDGNFEADFAVSLGGDGSLLRTAMWVADKGIPIAGVNTGHLGYLATIDGSRLCDLPAMVEQGALRLQGRSLIEAQGVPAEIGCPYALNEATFARSTAEMLSVEAELDGEPLATYRGDGLLVATPTGSTAYNLSVGGPLAHPAAPVLIVSPIATHSLTLRPLVVSDSSEIAIKVSTRSERFRLTLDSRSTQMEAGSTIVLRKAHFATFIYMPKEQTFAQTLHDKLNWGTSPL